MITDPAHSKTARKAALKANPLASGHPSFLAGGPCRSLGTRGRKMWHQKIGIVASMLMPKKVSSNEIRGSVDRP